MGPRIAIPMLHGVDLEYAERAVPQYERAVAMAGGEPVRIGLHRANAEVTRIVESCDGVLLPGSKADVDPERFRAARSPHTAAADPRREAADNLLLDDAYRRRKPVLGICYGLQSLNVYRGGSLVQHIPDFLPEETRGKVNHEAGKRVAIAHRVEIQGGSLMGRIVRDGCALAAEARHPRPLEIPTSGNTGQKWGTQVMAGAARSLEAVSGENSGDAGKAVLIAVNSSHHQSADIIGEGLRIVSRCPDDGIVEALEGTAPNHFVLAVQWHPERSVEEDEASRAIFRALVEACKRT